MNSSLQDMAYVSRCSATVLNYFDRYMSAFQAITARAARHFAARDWPAMDAEAAERLDLYADWVGRATVAASGLAADGPAGRHWWVSVKADLSARLAHRSDRVLAETFFNSVTRRVFAIEGIDPQLEFLREDADPDPEADCPDFLCLRFSWPQVSDTGVAELLTAFRDLPAFSDLDADVRRCVQRILDVHDRPGADWSVEMVRQPFFRDRSAYLIGRIRTAGRVLPLVFALIHDPDGLRVDALLLRTEDIRVLFSFTRAYFQVIAPYPMALIGFLKSLMPLKRKAELFIILGHHKHGKSELYRDLQHHQRVCRLDRFDLAPGARGMVMIAFSMADDDLIYKIIRDRFDTPKRATRRQVASKYDFVFRHDRAGRLLDVQTFDNLCLDLGCLAPALAAELRTQATRTARIVGDSVVFDSVYVERRVTPLDLFLKTAAADAARDAVIDYGNAIKDMARINIFAGDMLIKNFGVTRLGRVVFYDYDELMPLTECRFRRIPPARHVEDDMAAEPWFAVGDNDVFPEEFVFFLGLSPALRDVFMAHHADLLEVTFWRQCQARIHQGDWMPIWPYGPQERLRPAPADQP